MSAMPVTWYVAKCDSCGRLLGDAEYDIRFDSDYEDARSNRADAIEAAADDGWHQREEHDDITCPDCLECDVCGLSPAWSRDGRLYCEKHRTQIDNATCEAHVTVDAGTFEGRRISGSATFTPVPSDGKFIKWSWPVRVRTGHDILWTLDWDWLGFTVGCECGDRFTGDDENAAREEHAAHVDRVTQHAGQDPVLYHARNPYLPSHSKGHNRLDLIEIDGQPTRPRAWWRRLLLWS